MQFGLCLQRRYPLAETVGVGLFDAACSPLGGALTVDLRICKCGTLSSEGGAIGIAHSSRLVTLHVPILACPGHLREGYRSPQN